MVRAYRPVWQFVQRAEIETLAHIRDIIAILGRLAVIVGRGSGVLGAVAVPQAVRPHVLRAQCEPARETPVEQDLQTIEMIGPSAGFGVDFREPRSEEHTSELQSLR